MVGIGGLYASLNSGSVDPRGVDERGTVLIPSNLNLYVAPKIDE